MIIQCPGCRELVNMIEFTAHAGVLRFTCNHCGTGQELTSPPPAAPAPPAPAAPPAAPARPAASTREAVLWKAWDKALAQWDDSKAHDAFIATCQGADALPFAGTRYRERLQADPNNAAAQRGRDRVLGAAMVLAQAQRPAKEPRGPAPSLRWVRVALTLAAFLVAGLLVRQMATTSHRAASVIVEGGE